VESSDTVDLVRADNGEESHPNVLRVSFLDERHMSEAVGVSRVALADLLDEVLGSNPQA
jgi:hypothetical protein